MNLLVFILEFLDLFLEICNFLFKDLQLFSVSEHVGCILQQQLICFSDGGIRPLVSTGKIDLSRT